MSFYKEVPGRQTTLESTLKFDTTPTAGSTNPVTSRGVATAITEAVGGASDALQEQIDGITEIIPEDTTQSNLLMNMEGTERMINAMKPINALTLRFEFSKKDYDPDVAGIGSAGTWTKLDSPSLNIWDWTTAATDWHELFAGAFPDEDNKVRVIAAGDTSTVTNTKAMFAGQYTGSWPNSMSLINRNNIIACAPLDLSSCTDVSIMFYGSSLDNVVPIKFNSNPVELYGLFANTLIQEIKEYNFDGVENASNTVLSIFSFNALLTKVGRITGTENLSRCDILSKCPKLEIVDYISPFQNAARGDAQFVDCPKLKRLNYIIEMPNVTRIDSCFANCGLLEYIGGFVCGEGKITNAAGYLNACTWMNDNALPVFDTSVTTSFDHLMNGCSHVETVPDLDVSSVTNVSMAFRGMRRAKFGILEMYQKLSAKGAAISNHTKCFENCGIDTDEGRAALAQIPASWGGLAS